MLNRTWQRRLKTRRRGHGSLSAGESRKHWEEGAGGRKEEEAALNVYVWGPHLGIMSTFSGPRRERGRQAGVTEVARVTQPRGKNTEQRRGSHSSESPKCRDKTHVGLATCPRHTTLCCRAEAYSCSQRSSSKIFCS